jgi:hypothetical protein
MFEKSSERLWVYTECGVFRFYSRNHWESVFDAIVKRGWDIPSADEIGWLQSPLNPYPPGSFFTAADAASFAIAIAKELSECSGAAGDDTIATMQSLAELFATGSIFIVSEPPRETEFTDLVEVVYVYSCPKCGFMHHGRWLFDSKELNREEIGSWVKNTLKYKYCPICGSKDIVSVPFFLQQCNPERTQYFASRQACPSP